MAPLTTSRAQAIPPQASKTLRHFLHPHHPLHEVYVAKEFECDGCNALGHGKRYRCSACTFDLHERCATCPQMLSSHLHPAHPLALVNQSLGMVCDLCGDTVNGLYCTCRACRFDVHPLRTELPASVAHAAHPHHLLTLRPAEPRNCAVCRHVCGSWRYTCEPCHVDLHLECAFQEPVAGRQFVTAPVSTYHHKQHGYVVGVPSASPSYCYQYQPVIYQTIYNAMPINGGASMSTSGSDNRKRIYSILATIAAKVVIGSITGGFSC
ncbi:protein VACUOLELESS GAMETOPHYTES-like [Syzygium oleosum]|uniref:protein VACUOLELESS GAMETOPHYTES-like n=1 Tax=Syzygium oleosum TaxID=219896 RepID=UPI0011D26897|nr:protein VACUOLELESS GAMETOPHYTES-like [Syzygium oleosum]